MVVSKSLPDKIIDWIIMVDPAYSGLQHACCR